MRILSAANGLKCLEKSLRIHYNRKRKTFSKSIYSNKKSWNTALVEIHSRSSPFGDTPYKHIRERDEIARRWLSFQPPAASISSASRLHPDGCHTLEAFIVLCLERLTFLCSVYLTKSAYRIPKCARVLDPYRGPGGGWASYGLTRGPLRWSDRPGRSSDPVTPVGGPIRQVDSPFHASCPVHSPFRFRLVNGGPDFHQMYHPHQVIFATRSRV